MDDYIRRSDALELEREYYSQGAKEKAVPVTAIRNIPSADVVEAVRCKDCKHRPIHIDGKHPDSPYIDGCCYKDYTCPYLCDDDYYNRMPDDDWFCNHGEKKDGGT